MLYTGTALSASVAPVEEWNRTYDVGGYDIWAHYNIWSCQQVEDGGYILAGYVQRGNMELDSDIVLIKTDSAGNEEWNKTYGGLYDQSAGSVSQTRDGGYIVAGSDEIRGGWVVKTDAQGGEEWNRTFGEHRGSLGSVQETSDGGYIFAGSIDPFSKGESDAWLLKTDSYGKEEWNRTFGGAFWEFGCSVQETSDGGYILACATRSLDTDLQTAWLVKTDSSGNEEWSRYFGSNGYDYCMTSAKETTDGGYIIAGDIHQYDNYKDVKAWLAKTNADGEEEWNRTFDKGDYLDLYSAQQTSDGGYVFAGCSLNSDLGIDDSWLMKTNTDGYEEWNKTFEKAGSSIHCVQETKDKGYILAGITVGLGEGGSRPWLIKLAGEKVPEDPQDPLNEVKKLKDYVSNLENVDNSTKNILTVKLENAVRNLEKGEAEKAISKLEQFTDSVNKLSLQNKISADQANVLIQKIQGITELIEN